jgi:E3 ubiquitin-protein ligase HECTD4
MAAVRSGMASVYPLQLLAVMTPGDMELRTCGLPEVNLDFLKVNALSKLNHTVMFFDV